LVAILGVFALAVTHFSKATEVATAVASVSGVIAALVGAYFGIRGTTVAQGQAMEMMAQHFTPPDQTTSGEQTPPKIAPRPPSV
jgi:hypothetical protein